MSEAEQLGNVILSLLAVLALLVVLDRVLLSTVIEAFRQDVFRIRRRAFLLVASGQVRADNGAYVALRDGCNGLLRCAEEISFLRMLLDRWLGPDVVPLGESLLEDFERGLAAISNATAREELARLDEELGKRLASFVWTRSPLAWIVTPLVLLVAALRRRSAKREAIPAATPLAAPRFEEVFQKRLREVKARAHAQPVERSFLAGAHA